MSDKPKRRTVVVDIESSGLGENDIPLEVAYWCLDTDQRDTFLTPHNEQWVLDHGHPDALRINGYKERILGQPQDDGTKVRQLHEVLRGQCIAGMNVGRADCTWLYRLFKHHSLHQDPWHYRLGEIGPFAAGVLGIPLEEAPGLADLCVILGVPPEPEVHSAANGVDVTGKCLLELRRRRAGITAVVDAHTNHCMQAEAVVKAPEAAA